MFGLVDDRPKSATRKEWFCITRELVANTITDIDIDPEAMSQVEKTFLEVGLL